MLSTSGKTGGYKISFQAILVEAPQFEHPEYSKKKKLFYVEAPSKI